MMLVVLGRLTFQVSGSLECIHASWTKSTPNRDLYKDYVVVMRKEMAWFGRIF